MKKQIMTYEQMRKLFNELVSALEKSQGRLEYQQKLGCECNGIEKCGLCKQIEKNEKLLEQIQN